MAVLILVFLLFLNVMVASDGLRQPTTISNAIAHTSITHAVSLAVVVPVAVYASIFAMKFRMPFLSLLLAAATIGVVVFRRQSNVSDIQEFSSEMSGHLHRISTVLFVLLVPLVLAIHIKFTRWLLFLYMLLVLNICMFVALSGAIYTCNEFEVFQKHVAVHEYASAFLFIWILMEST